MKTYLVTGGAGFIGSNIVAGLTKKYPNDKIVVCDYYGKDNDKWRNNVGHPADEYISPNELFYWLEMNATSLDAIIHMGAVSSTTATDSDQTIEVNFTLSKIIRMWCIENEKRFIYASSASVYGDGTNGFKDDISLEYMSKLRPLNTYAWSKYVFDYHIARSLHRKEPQPPQWAGLRFFNVYGPNEYHKGDQQSVMANIYPRAKEGLQVNLFKSYREDYQDGGQRRDFIYVKDCVSVVLWLLDNPNVSGIYNVGTGKARSFNCLAHAVFAAVEKDPRINYIEMPNSIREKYQYFTEANMTKLIQAGYDKPFHSLEEGVVDYVRKYLMTSDPYL